MKILGKIGVVGDNQRQVERAAVFSAAIIESDYTQHGGIGDMDQVGLEFSDRGSHGGAGQGKVEFRVEGEGMAPDAHDAALLELTKAAVRRKNEDLVTETAELLHGLA